MNSISAQTVPCADEKSNSSLSLSIESASTDIRASKDVVFFLGGGYKINLLHSVI